MRDVINWARFGAAALSAMTGSPHVECLWIRDRCGIGTHPWGNHSNFSSGNQSARGKKRRQARGI
jgi:hypothetical protein